MNEEYIYVKTDAVQKDMHDFVNQFGDEISSLSYVGNTIKLKNGVVYRFTYNTIGIRKYYTYTEIYNHHLEFKFNKLQKENKQLKGSLQTYEILLKANVEENQQLKEQLQQKGNIINKAKEYCNFGIKEWITDDGFVEEVLKDVLQILEKSDK